MPETDINTTPPRLPYVTLALALAAGLLLTAGYALHPLWWAPWLAPVALILAGRGSVKQATWTGALAGALAMTSVIGYYLGLTPWPIAALLFVLRMVAWMGMARAAYGAGQRLPLGLAMLMLPAMAAGLEWLTLAVSPHGSAGSLAYSQMDLPGVFQVAAVGGAPAVVFIVLLPGSLVGLWLSRKRAMAETAVAAALVVAGAAGVGVYSYGRLTTPEAGRTLPVVLLASDRFPGIPQDWDAVWSLYGPAVADKAPAGGLIVLPEKLALVDGVDAARAAGDIRRAAMAGRTTIIAGIEVHDGVYRNRAVIAYSDGRVGWYDKQRLVPGLEARDVPGRTPVRFGIGSVAGGVAICKDMHIPSIGRQYAGQAGVMAVPAWDFGDDGWMGARMTALRAVENGYSIARSSRNGLVGAYDSRGRVIAEQASSAGMTMVAATIPAQAQPTLYGRIGEIFGMICMAVACGLIGLMRFRRGRSI